VAEALGCSPQAIGHWLNRYEVENGIRSDGLTCDEREELKTSKRGDPAQAGKGSPRTSRGLLRGRPVREKYRLVEAEKARTPINVSCHLLGSFPVRVLLLGNKDAVKTRA
jgi:hypothetical protein